MLVLTLFPEGVMSQMIFSHDTELTLRAACGLVNSDRVEGEQLGDMAALEAYLNGWGWTGRRDHDGAELASIHRLRERLAKIWEVADDEVRAVGQVNALLSDTKASPWLTRHPEQPEWHLHLASVHDPLWQRMGAEMAMALADIIRIGELRRLKVCAAPDWPLAAGCRTSSRPVRRCGWIPMARSWS